MVFLWSVPMMMICRRSGGRRCCTTSVSPIITGNTIVNSRVLFGCLLLLQILVGVNASLPTAVIHVVSPQKETFYVSEATYGPSLPFQRNGRLMVNRFVFPPSDDIYLCNPVDESMFSRVIEQNGPVVLVPRGGGCSFLFKTYKAQLLLGVKPEGNRPADAAVFIYNNLGSRYGVNDTESDKDATIFDVTQYGTVIWPLDKDDYECGNGDAVVPLETLNFTSDGVYVDDINSPQLTGTDSLCDVHSSSFLQSCPSKRCLLTGQFGSSDNANNNATMHACCAWDISQGMAGDSINETIWIPSLFLTMSQGDDIMSLVENSFPTTLELYKRDYPPFNAASIILLCLGTFITWLASFLSAREYRNLQHRLTKAMTEDDTTPNPNTTTGPITDEEQGPAPNIPAFPIGTPPRSPMQESESEEEEEDLNGAVLSEEEQNEYVVVENSYSASPNTYHGNSPSANSAGSGAVEIPTEPAMIRDSHDDENIGSPSPAREPRQSSRTRRPRRAPRRAQQQEGHIELKMYHAVIFLVVASAFLFILFFLELYTAVEILYGIGCSGAMVQILFFPLYTYLAGLHAIVKKWWYRPLLNIQKWGINGITRLDSLAVLSGYSIGVAWLCVGLLQDSPDTNVFYWVTQNVMGACICITFLSVIKLNSIKVATVLLLAAFVYDIFFVFITPYLFDGESIMISVATSGGAPDDPNFCEKYPDGKDCQGGDPLPMLLTIPRINDYRGGAALLGLGDIVLPGLLISFAARLDAAKALVQTCNLAVINARGNNPTTDATALDTTTIHS
eukprot:scaffold101748_cov59-Attheya_sp.AAC.2